MSVEAGEMAWPTTIDERTVVERSRIAAVLALPQRTLFRCGWYTPHGNVQGGTYYRAGDGLAPTGRDRGLQDTLRYAVQGCYDKPWAIEVLAEPVERQIIEVQTGGPT